MQCLSHCDLSDKDREGISESIFSIKSVIGFMTLIYYHNVRILGFVNTIIKKPSFYSRSVL